MVNTLHPSGLTPGSTFTEPGNLKVGVAFTVSSTQVVDGIYAYSPVAQLGGYVALWRDPGTTDTELVRIIDIDFAAGDNYVPFSSTQTLTTGHTYVAMFGVDTALGGGGSYPFSYSALSWHGATDGAFVYPDPPGRYALPAGDSPTGTSSNWYGVSVYQITGATPISVTTTSPVSTATGNLTTLNAVGHDGSGAKTWAWTQASGPSATLSGSTTATPSFTPATTGTYVFNVSLTDDSGNATGSVTVNVSAPTAVSVTASSPVTATTGVPVTLHATAADGSGSKTWSTTQQSGATASISAGTTANPVITTSAAGDAVIRITVTDATGSAHVDVTVTSTDAPTRTRNTLWVDVNGTWIEIGNNTPNYVFTPEDYGAVADGVTNDQEAITEAINAAVAYAISSGTYYAEVQFDSATYLVSGATVKGGDTFGNAQIPLPVIPDTDRKVVLALKGAGDVSVFNHWKQTVPQHNGTVIKTTLTGQTPDGTWKSPSVIGGPTVYTQPSEPGITRFSNMMLHADNIQLVAPFNPSVIGFDFRQVGEVNVGTISAMADAAVVGSPTLTTIPTNDNGIGVYFPVEQNNARSQVDAITVQGFFYAAGVSEHFTANTFGAVYCDTALFVRGAGNSHGVSIQYACIEACNTYVEYIGDGHLPVFIALLNGEGVSSETVHVNDPNNGLYGEINVADIYKTPVVNGGANIRVLDAQRAIGPVTAPSVPATTVALRNPFWRDATVYVAGGTVSKIEIAGTDIGITSGAVRVPTGKTITLTYSAAPTWKWILE